MSERDREGWMWAEACEMLARAERLHRQFFQPTRGQARLPTWEPPADVVETERELLILIALPGVDPDRVEAHIENGSLVVLGQRTLPSELRDAVIHRLEIPLGRFERRLPLPAGRYEAARRYAVHGCLLVTLRKL
jgi:HSP20 family molecular chaperone IbpA